MKSLLRLCTIIILISIEMIKVNSTHELIVTNNGPSILDSVITFSAVVHNYVPRHDLVFVFDDGIQKSEHSVESSNVTQSISFPSDRYHAGVYFMNVTVKFWNFIFYEILAENSSTFTLQRDLIGIIDIYRGDEVHPIDVDEVAVGENVSFVLNLVDHNNYLENAIVDYSWSIDFEKQQTLGSTLIYNFSGEGLKDVKAIATATFPNNDFKFGAFERTVTAKVPVNNVNVSGNPFLYHGDTLNLNITCNGTPPFIYCSEILRSNISSGNFSCSHFSTFTTCHMEIMKYFQDDGTYHVGIYISNNVQKVTRVIEVMVYSVSVNPTLSTIIIPIVCSLLTLMIIAVGISYCIQQRNQLAVEVANFDFHDESDSYTERTFFENMLDSVFCRNAACGRCNSPSEVEPLI